MLFEFLPTEYKKEVKKLYQSKVITLYAIGAICLFGASIFLLLPSYMLVRSEKKAIEGETSALSQSMVDSKENEAKQFVTLAKEKISFARDTINKKLFTDALTRIVDNSNSSIKITSIAFTRGDENNKITISGTASTRDELLAFTKVLESEELFSAVDLPVSNLAKNRNIDFSVSITEPK